MRREYFTLLIIDRLTIDLKRCLRVVAQWVEKPVRVGDHSGNRHHDRIAQPRARCQRWEFAERGSIDIGMRKGNVFDNIRTGGFDGHALCDASYRKHDLRGNGNGRPDVHILRRR